MINPNYWTLIRSNTRKMDIIAPSHGSSVNETRRIKSDKDVEILAEEIEDLDPDFYFFRS